VAASELTGRVSRARLATAAIIATGLFPTACARGDTAPDPEKSGGTVDVRLDVGVPTWGEFGLAVLEFRMPRALTAEEAAHVQLRMRGVASEKVVSATAKVSDNRRVVTVVTSMIRRRRGPVRRHGLMLEGNAVLPGGDSVHGGRVQLIDGFLFHRDARRSSRQAAGGAVPAGSPAGGTAGSGGRCARVNASLRGAAAPRLLSGARAGRRPSHRLRNGSPLVSNATRAGLVLDQTLGQACKPPFGSRWLTRLAGWRGPPA
jgi:hypothetical protein